MYSHIYIYIYTYKHIERESCCGDRLCHAKIYYTMIFYTIQIL